jgi:amino acid transporter
MPFIRDNVRRLRWIAGLLAGLWVYHLFLPTLTDELSVYAGPTRNALNNFGQAVGENIPWYLTNGYLAVALLLLILAQIFSYGVRLQKDVEGLV